MSAERITPPDGYGNANTATREGASAPDAAPEWNGRDIGRTILTNLRCPVCGASVVMFKDQVQFDKRAGKHFLITECCKAVINYDDERRVPRHDPVNHPAHYTTHPSGIECIEITRHMNFNLGNAIKYIWRADMKAGLEDLKKAQWYLNDEITRRS